MNKAVILLIFLLIPLAYADIVTENGITIESDKSIYYCQPIFNEKGECLINAEIKITYNVPDPSPITIISEYSTPTSKTEFYQDNLYNEKEFDPKAEPVAKPIEKITAQDITDKRIEPTKDFKSLTATSEIPLKTNQVIVTKISFWAKQDGKFNIRVKDGKVETILDQYTISQCHRHHLHCGCGMDGHCKPTNTTIQLSLT